MGNTSLDYAVMQNARRLNIGAILNALRLLSSHKIGIRPNGLTAVYYDAIFLGFELDRLANTPSRESTNVTVLLRRVKHIYRSNQFKKQVSMLI